MTLRAALAVAVLLAASAGCSTGDDDVSDAQPSAVLPEPCGALTERVVAGLVGVDVDLVVDSETPAGWSCTALDDGYLAARVRAVVGPFDDELARLQGSDGVGGPAEIALPRADRAVQLDVGAALSKHLWTVASSGGVTYVLDASAATRDEEARIIEGTWAGLWGDPTSGLELDPWRPGACRGVTVDLVTAALGRPVELTTSEGFACEFVSDRDDRVAIHPVGRARADGYAESVGAQVGKDVVELERTRGRAYLVPLPIEGIVAYLGDELGIAALSVETGDAVKDERVLRALVPLV